MNTRDIMNLALEMIGEEQIPPDSAIYYPGQGIKKVLMGIDIGVAELALARELGYDLVIAHHPQGAVRTFYKILDKHVQQLVEAGVPETVARKAVVSLKEKHELRAHIANCDHVPSFARLLNMPFMNIHYPLDELGRRRMVRAIENHFPPEGTVESLIKALNTIPEFLEADTEIKVLMGRKENAAGKIAVSHGAGTNGGYSVASAYFDYGVDTLIYIHIDYGDLQKLKEKYGESRNLIVTGHIPSDAAGINPFIKELENKGIIVDRVSGL